MLTNRKTEVSEPTNISVIDIVIRKIFMSQTSQGFQLPTTENDKTRSINIVKK